MVKVLVVDDLPSVRRIMKMQIELAGDLEVVGEADNQPDVLELVPKLKPDVVLLDLDMPDMDGIATTRKLSTLGTVIPVVTMSFDDNETLRARAREAGAVDFVKKQVDTENLIEAIRRAATSAR